MSSLIPLVKIEKITVRADRVSFDMRLADEAPLLTNPEIARAALRVHPSLAQHTCVNSGGSVFGDVMESTPIIHLLEHMAVDILVTQARAQGTRATFTGTSEWIDKPTRRARIELSYIDDLQTLAAFKQACNELVHLLRA